MANRTTENLNKLIYTLLSGDSTLQTLLGGAGRVKHGNPENLSEYPMVTYQFITELDNPYLTDQASHIVVSRLVIQSFSNNTSSKQVDSIDDRVYELLDGEKIGNSDVQVYSSYRVSREPTYEGDIKVWKVTASYDITNVTN